MLIIYGVIREEEHGNLYLHFYLRKADAKAAAKDHNNKNVKIVPVEVNETYEGKDNMIEKVKVPRVGGIRVRHSDVK